MFRACEARGSLALALRLSGGNAGAIPGGCADRFVRALHIRRVVNDEHAGSERSQCTDIGHGSPAFWMRAVRAANAGAIQKFHAPRAQLNV